MHRVAIVGGGPGGLMTAQFIARKYGADFSCTIFEATSRLGGKLQTRRFSAVPVPYEAGAAELYDYSTISDDPFRRFVDQLGLRTRPLRGHSVVLNGMILRNDEDIATHCGNATLHAIEDFRRQAARLLPLDRWHPDDWQFDATHPWVKRTCAELLDTVTDPVARKYLQITAHSDLATEPHLTDGLTGLKNFVMDNPGYVSCRVVEGGMSRFAERLVDGVGAAEVRVDTRVVRVEQNSAGSWRVTSTCNNESCDDEFDAVILALPATQLTQIEYASEMLSRFMTQHLTRYDRPGHYLRVSLLFRTPFWKERLSGSWFMIDAFGGACVYDESARHEAGSYGVLGFLIAGNHALVMSNDCNSELVRSVLAALPAELRCDAAEQLLEAKVHRWCGAVSAQPAGNPARDPRTSHQPDPVQLPGLLLVGDYLVDSTLSGVHQSAELATTLLARHLHNLRPLQAAVGVA